MLLDGVAPRWRSGSQAVRRPLPPPEANFLVVKLNDAFHVNHRRRIVYRDTRSTKVVFSDRNEPTLVDFGLAKRLDHSGCRTRNGAATGDPRYMARRAGDWEESHDPFSTRHPCPRGAPVSGPQWSPSVPGDLLSRMVTPDSSSRAPAHLPTTVNSTCTPSDMPAMPAYGAGATQRRMS